MTRSMNAAERRESTRETDDTWADYASHADQRTPAQNAELRDRVEAGRAKLRRG